MARALRSVAIALLLTPPRTFAKTCADDLLRTLHPVHQAYLRCILPTALMLAPEELRLNARALPVIGTLGVGREGAVYLAHEGEALAAIKVFHGEADFEAGLAPHRAWQKLLPRILETDPERRSVLMEYVDGVELGQLSVKTAEGLALKPRVRSLSISRARLEAIEAGFERWRFAMRKSHRPRGEAPRPTRNPLEAHPPAFELRCNVIYSFALDDYRLIDHT